MTHGTRIVGLVIALGAAAATAAAQGPVGELYVTAGQQRMMHVLQGGAVVRSWAITGEGQYEYPLAVIEDVRTLGAQPGQPGVRYDFSGVDLGERYAFPNGIGTAWDGTTDGVHNYTLDFTNGGVYRLDLDWANGTMIFNTPPQWLGITYDPSDDTLWIASWGENRVEQRDLSGNTISSFTTELANITCLAMDPSDGTLWLGSQQRQGTFWQYSRAGQVLRTVNYPELVSQNTLGGEFQFGGAGCVYTVKKSKSKRDCQTCPPRGGEYRSQAECEEVQDCDKKVKTTIGCPGGGNGICKIKGKRSSCG